jgi:hypothetical protein
MTEADESGAQWPDTVFVPTEASHDHEAEVAINLRRTEGGELALLVYSTLEHLVASCGENQPWVQIPTDELDDLQAELPYDMVLLDIALPDEMRDGRGPAPEHN